MTEPETGRILVVDDNIANLHLLVTMLSKHGYTLSVAKSGEEAVDLSLKSPLDLILLDIMMPGMDGYSTCEVLKAMPDTHDIPIIFLSALDDVASKTKGFEVGGVDYVSKPFHEAEVIARIQTHISLSRTRRNLEQTIEQLSLTEEELRQNYEEILAKDHIIQESQAQLRTIFSLVPNPILLTRVSDGSIVDCNHAMASLIESTPTDLLGTVITDLKLWNDETDRQRFVHELRTSGRIDNREMNWKNRSGDTMTFLISSRIIEIEGEAIIISVGFDYTKLKSAEQQLRESEEMYRNPVEQSPVGVFLFQDGHFRYVNPRLSMMFGYSRTDIESIPLSELVMPVDLPQVTERLIRANGGDLSETRIEFQGIRSSGTILDLELYASYMQYQGRPAVYGTIIDVTYRNQIEQARFQSEQMYRLITENMKDVVCIIDYPSLAFQYISPSVMALSGYSAEELTGKTLPEVITPETLPTLVDIWNTLSSQTCPNPDRPEYCTAHAGFVCKNGNIIETEVVASSIKNQVTGTPEVLCVIRDISRQVQSERENELSKQELFKKNEELVASNEELIIAEEERTRAYNELTLNQQQLMEQEHALIEANKEKEILLREIHHRVKNNMQVISSLLSMQSRSIQDPTIQTLFKEAQTRVRSLSLVHELLYKSDSLKNINYRMYLQDLTRVIFDSHNATRRDIKCLISPYEVQISIEKAVPCSLVLTELLTNSLKYAFPDGISGEIHIDFQYDSETGWYQLRYRDTGVGFPEGMNLQGNTGFGSSLIKGLTRQLSGSLHIESGNPGVLYTLRFPSDL